MIINDPPLEYQSGFGNEFATEAIKGALPVGQNSPQRCPFDLYAEQMSGSAFTAPRGENRRTWMYRIVPSVVHKPYHIAGNGLLRSTPFAERPAPPNQLRWSPISIPSEPTTFVQGLHTMGGNGDAIMQSGVAIHVYVANTSMKNEAFYNADGEMLIVPQQGGLKFITELGCIIAKPKEIVVIPRGIKFKVELLDDNARGYICENYGAPFRLPDLGPIGANGLANPRDFETPIAAFEDVEQEYEFTAKFQGNLWKAESPYSPFSVVAWLGNYAPYKYDLEKFMVINTVSFDHPDPSIFTVLTSPSEIRGTANADFVIFPPRWMVAEHTFRPPWFHRNFMSEFMGLITGEYDAKAEGFVPGGCSLHNQMAGHGPDAATFERASSVDLKPQYIDKTMAFMFETRFAVRPTEYALSTAELQHEYYTCWQDLKPTFAPFKHE
jgi:homogentisate 1,2-dioxygenase